MFLFSSLNSELKGKARFFTGGVKETHWSELYCSGVDEGSGSQETLNFYCQQSISRLEKWRFGPALPPSPGTVNNTAAACQTMSSNPSTKQHAGVFSFTAAHKRAGINALCAQSDQILLCTIRQFTSGPAEKHFQPRVPAEGKCIKAPDLRL